jgi:hypothetical protein
MQVYIYLSLSQKRVMGRQAVSLSRKVQMIGVLKLIFAERESNRHLKSLLNVRRIFARKLEGECGNVRREMARVALVTFRLIDF